VLESDILPGWRDNFLTADINQPIDLLDAFDWGPDVVFLASAIVSRVVCEQASALAITTNLGGINNVFQLCKRTKATCVFFSTSEVYGPDVDPMDEALPNPRPNNRYGLSKFLGEQMLEYEVRSYGLRAVSLRPFMMYDEDEDWGDHRSAMIRFATNLASGRPIEVHRGAARGWLHVTDAVRAIEAAGRVKEYSVINIGHPDVIPIEELARRVATRLGAPAGLIRERELPGRMTLVKRPTLERQRRILGIEPKVTLDEGIDLVCRRVLERRAAGERVPGDEVGAAGVEPAHLPRG
jgi:nucleoside-diphosphate-sugar epimerase